MKTAGKLSIYATSLIVIMVVLSMFAIAVSPILSPFFKEKKDKDVKDKNVLKFLMRSGEVLVEAMDSNGTRGEVTNWERGGTYRVYVYAENAATEIVDVAQWRLNAPSYLNNTDYGRPAADLDFFDGAPMNVEWLFGVGGTSALIVEAGYGAEPGDIGYLEYYDFYVQEDAPLEDFDLLLDNLQFGNSSGDPLNYSQTDDYSFRIVEAIPPCPNNCGDITLNGGNVDLSDFSYFALCFGLRGSSPQCSPMDFSCSDMNGDGWVDLNDFARFAYFFGQPVPGDGYCEYPVGAEKEFLAQLPEDPTIEDLASYLAS